jgi:hypothetical protein
MEPTKIVETTPDAVSSRSYEYEVGIKDSDVVEDKTQVTSPVVPSATVQVKVAATAVASGAVRSCIA